MKPLSERVREMSVEELMEAVYVLGLAHGKGINSGGILYGYGYMPVVEELERRIASK